MLPGEQQPVDVTLAEPDRAGISAARRAARGNGVMCLYGHVGPQIHR